ncbi:unnamed protein product [Ceutorhynchus assimilis]|uniref:SAM-dependent MTase RsmB/NOP-type domain-containing protein n=1 Tax=Ceutorhynchus assimilis TaxID=467358 RepID=A0A9N9MJH5_9CUCU|nr:unnamed protein product [Ceutorhynchus assimilis]
MNKGQKSTFNHSVKVPKLYKCAAKIAQDVAEGAGSIKQLVYEKTHFNTKALYALVATSFQKSNEIDLLLKRTKLLDIETRLDSWLAKILISELMWGKGQLPNSGAKPIQTILSYEQAFRAHLSDTFKDNNYTEDKHLTRGKPRYIRINTLINSMNEALELFQEEGWTLIHPSKENTYTSFLEQVENLEDNCFLRDFHVPELLVFPGGTEFYNHPGYKKGVIILQDKASCLPVHILSPPPGSVVLDMCAAPGMKTTQLAATLQDNGIVYAVERDPKRFEILKKMVEVSGATCVNAINEDVLQCNVPEFSNVEYITVDPSCSGSGMINRLEINKTPDNLRLQKLAGFQIKILRSALTRYPNAKKIVYSTCSLNPEENEDVVRQVLETNNQFKLIPAIYFVNNQWINYGSSDFSKIGQYTLYARPEVDLTNGFFVAVFERLEEGENNEFYNGRVLQYRKKIEQNENRKERKYRESYNTSNMIEDTDCIAANEINNKIIENPIKDKIGPEKEVSNEVAPDSRESIFDESTITEEVSIKKHKKKKHKDIGTDECVTFVPQSTVASKKSKKKKHKHLEEETQIEVAASTGDVCDEPERKKKKKNKNPTEDRLLEVSTNVEKRKKKKSKEESVEIVGINEKTEGKPRRKKKMVECVD